MKEITVEIKGKTPLLMNKYNVQAELDRTKGKRVGKTYIPEEEAEKSAYWSSGSKKELIIPYECVYRSMLNASAFHKVLKRSAKQVLAGSLRIEPFEISLGTSKYEIDTRPVVIQGNRVLKNRAMLKQWKAKFTIVYDEKLIQDPTIIRTVLTEAGQRIGIMDYRPQKSGPFGTFEVTQFNVK